MDFEPNYNENQPNEQPAEEKRESAFQPQEEPRPQPAQDGFYHYSYVRPERAAPVQPPVKNKKPLLRTVALCLSCALLGAALGAGGFWLGSRSGKETATLYVSDRKAVEVETQRVDGVSLMTESEIYSATVESVVSINSTTTTNYFGQATESASSGSGFILTTDGYIATNYHVVGGAGKVTVTLYNGDEYEAEIIGGEEDYDIAVLKIDVEGLPAVTMGDSSAMHVGDRVVAIGNPLGELTFSLAPGMVSCLDRVVNVDGTPFNMMQVSASVNPGNSGGPLFNMYGEVVGIVSAKYSSYANTTVEGLAFAIPMNDVRAMLEDIMENGQVTNKAYMGLTPGTVSSSMAAQYGLSEGVYVYSVEKGSAAEKAGILAGDVIVELAGKTVTSVEELNAAKKSYFAGDTVEVKINRQGEELTLNITFDVTPSITEQPQQTPQQPNRNDQSYQDAWEDFYNYFFGGGGYGNPFWGYFGR